METTEIATQARVLSNPLAKRVLQVSELGQKKIPLFWIEKTELRSFCKHLRDDFLPQQTWVENISAFPIDGCLIVTYFVGRDSGQGALALRVTADWPSSKKGDGFFPSLDKIWASAAPFERKLADRFGIQFSWGGHEIG